MVMGMSEIYDSLILDVRLEKVTHGLCGLHRLLRAQHIRCEQHKAYPHQVGHQQMRKLNPHRRKQHHV